MNLDQTATDALTAFLLLFLAKLTLVQLCLCSWVHDFSTNIFSLRVLLLCLSFSVVSVWF